MRVLFTTQPGVGHLHPMLPLARGMAQRGHEVAFACGFVPEVERAGFRSYPVGWDWLTIGMEQAFPELREIPPGSARYAWLRVNVFAAGLDDPAQAAPTHHQLRPVGAVPAPEEGEPTLAWLRRMPARSTVYATLGTVYNSMVAVFTAILGGLREEPLNLILTVGRNQDPAQFGSQPAHVCIERFVPQALLLPRHPLTGAPAEQPGTLSTAFTAFWMQNAVKRARFSAFCIQNAGSGLLG